MTVCKNCALSFEGKYCPTCGQKASVKRFSTKILFSQLMDKLLPLDRGVLFTTWQILKRPGGMIREYLDGKRVGYTKPFQFLLIITALSLLVFPTEQLGAGIKSGINQTPDARHAEVIAFQEKLVSFIMSHLTLLMTGMLPLLALTGRWFYRKHDVNYAEHFVMNCYLLAGCTILSTPFVAFFRLSGQPVVSPAYTMGFLMLYLGFFAYGHVTLFRERNRWWNGFKGICTYMVAYLLYIVLIGLLSVIAIVAYIVATKQLAQ